MRNSVRIKELEDKFKKFECETKLRLWTLDNPPQFKRGDVVWYCEIAPYFHAEIHGLTILDIKGLKPSKEEGSFPTPIRDYYVVDERGKVYELDEKYLRYGKPSK